jgi:hypothetical protein
MIYWNTDPQEMLEKNREFYRLFIPDAQKAGVKICVENMFRMDLNSKIIRDSICASPYEFAKYVDTFNQDADIFCACLDVGHCVVTSHDPANAVRVLGSRIEALHVHDSSLFRDRHTCPLTDSLDQYAVAEALKEFRAEVDALEASGVERSSAVMEVVRKFVTEAKDIMFEGNGYSREWEAEAASRGLRAVKNVPEAYEVYHEPQTVELFDRLGVLAPNEVEARFEILNETYVKKLQIEARIIGDICLNHVIPAAVRYQNVLIENVKGLKEIFGADYMQYCSSEIATLKKISTYINNVSADVEALVEARKVANRVEDIAMRAKMYSHQVKDMMDKVRLSADNLEMLIDDEVWPLPKYRELLFF